VGLGFVLGFGAWATWQDIEEARMDVLRTEVQMLRSQAVRRVAHLEKNLNEKYADVDWLTLRNDPWVTDYWAGVMPLQEHELYAAIVFNRSNIIILHSQPELVDGQLTHNWYERKLSEAGDDVFELNDSVLSDGKHAYDIRIPIKVNRKEMAAYHEGLDASWVEAEMDRVGWDVFEKWAIVITGMLASMSLAVGALAYIASRKASLVKAIRLAQLEHMLQIEKLAAGLAHEIRNPLHAMRLNLHTLGRAWRGQTQLTEQDVAAMIRESNVEIDRVERLMQELLGFAKPEAPRNETFAAGSVVKATVNFLREEMRRKGVAVETEVPADAVYVQMDPSRLRQVLINLLGNAREAVQEGGQITVSVDRRPGRAEIVVADDGPGVDEADREQVFEPFYSTKQNGSGFGLALVRRFVEEAGGRVVCEANRPRGARFRVELPLALSRPRSAPPQTESVA
jgi:signal transduction histidine kinase